MRNIVDIEFRRIWILWLAVAVEVLSQLVLPDALYASTRTVALGTSVALVGVWLAINTLRQTASIRTALTIVTVGYLLNGVVIVLNGGMPVSPSAMEMAGVPIEIFEGLRGLHRHVLMDEQTMLPFLGDVVPVPMGPLGKAVSIGDFVLMAGVVHLVSSCMLRVSVPRRIEVQAL